jgi:hypothetical protein
MIVISLVIGINLLNLIFMLGVRHLMVFPGLMFWRVLGRLLAVVVFAIAIQIGVAGLRGYGLVS